MSENLKSTIIEKLKSVRGPDLKGDIISLDLVSEIYISDKNVTFSITVPENQGAQLEPMRQAAEKVVTDIEGVEKVIVSLTAERPSQTNIPKDVYSSEKANHSNPVAQNMMQGSPQPQQESLDIAGAIIAVASGKGGVGKSTTSVNLALSLQALGLSVGILDADIYGPSMPRLLRLTGRPEVISGNTLRPLNGYGMNVMSIGFLIEEDTPMVWRGPMVISAITQMLKDVAWEKPDVLIVDMPPGTGDAQLTMAQQVPLAGAVIVSTPQDLALIDARKGINMFRKVEVPIIGIVENMSYFLCPSCGHRSDIFGHGGAEAEADRIGVPFLGGVPLHMDIRAQSDEGQPIVVAQPDSEHAKIYKNIAETVWQRLQLEQGMMKEKQPPKISIE